MDTRTRLADLIDAGLAYAEGLEKTCGRRIEPDVFAGYLEPGPEGETRASYEAIALLGKCRNVECCEAEIRRWSEVPGNAVRQAEAETLGVEVKDLLALEALLGVNASFGEAARLLREGKNRVDATRLPGPPQKLDPSPPIAPRARV